MRRYAVLGSMLLFVTLSACEDISTDPNGAGGAGEFTAEVTGDVTATHSGVAEWGTETGLADLVIAMAEDNALTITISWDDPADSAGTYTIDGEQLRAAYRPEGAIHGADSGELRITSFGDTIEGTFDFTASTGSGQIQVTGSFEAVKAD